MRGRCLGGERYARALDPLDAYDHQGIRKPEGCPGGVVLVYEECRAFVDALGFREFSSSARRRTAPFGAPRGHLSDLRGGWTSIPPWRRRPPTCSISS